MTDLFEAETTKNGSRHREVHINFDTNVSQLTELARQAVGMACLDASQERYPRVLGRRTHEGHFLSSSSEHFPRL